MLVTSNRTALIEMVPNAPSLHTIKSRSPPGSSLAAHFFAKFGKVRIRHHLLCCNCIALYPCWNRALQQLLATA